MRIRLFAYCLMTAGFLFGQEWGDRKITTAPSAEMVFSSRLNSGFLGFDLAHDKATVGGTYYGSGSYQVGALSVGKPFHTAPWLKLVPGFGAAMIKNRIENEESATLEETASPYRSIEPVAVLRWQLEKGRLVSEGNLLLALLATEGRRNFYSDGSHISLKFGRFEPGFTFALANHGLERERKYGGRFAVKVWRFSLGVMALGPGKTDIRGIFAYNGERQEE